jgi:hypothetical protein
MLAHPDWTDRKRKSPHQTARAETTIEEVEETKQGYRHS